MKLRTKIAIDKILGNTFIFIIGIAIKFIRLFLKSSFKKIKPVKRIAVCKLLGMGSIIQSTSLINSLRANFPNAELIFITTKKNIDLLKIIKPVDKIYAIDDSNIFILLMSLAKFKIYFLFNRIDYYFDLEVHSNFSTILTLLSFSRNKIGYYLKEEWFRICLYTEMIFYNTNAPVNSVYNQSLKLLGIKEEVSELYDFDNTDSSSQFSFDSDYIVINPNASDLRIERRWYYKNYVELINSILEENRSFRVILTGSKTECDYVNKIYSEIDNKYKSNVMDTSGKLSIEELINLIRNCKLLITNDSGPLHIAFALKKKTVALFGPCSPRQYIIHKNVYFIYKNIYCSPCVHQFTISPCKGDNQCMKQLKIGEVKKIIENILRNDSLQPNRLIDQNIIYTNDTNFPLGILKNKA